ncbi:MAG: RsmE family RNA methyltransferase [Planctomycetota bacterium]
MSDRFYAPDLGSFEGTYTLEGPEAHHLRTVCRGKPGDHVELFDGKGLEARGELLEVLRHEAVIRVLDQRMNPEPSHSLDIACAIPKGDRGVWLVEKCVELGVTRLIPLRTERSITEAGDGKLEKFRRTVIEACKQSRRPYLLSIGEPVVWDSYLQASSPGWVLDPRGDAPVRQAGDVPNHIAIGPEGGWTQDELASARNQGWKSVRVPGNILRVETAAVAIAAWVRVQGSCD